MGIRTKLKNAWAIFKNTFAWDLLFREPDGRLVPMNKWSGFDTCARPGCGHCCGDHSFENEYTAIYSLRSLKGAEDTNPLGCIIEGCSCGGFMEDKA